MRILKLGSHNHKSVVGVSSHLNKKVAYSSHDKRIGSGLTHKHYEHMPMTKIGAALKNIQMSRPKMSKKYVNFE